MRGEHSERHGLCPQGDAPRAGDGLGARGGFALVALLAACSTRPTLTEASAFANQLAEEFYPLEAWAHRALSADMVPSTADVFDERIFAPVRGRDDVVEAWLVRIGTSDATYSARGSRPVVDDSSFARVRMSDHRELRVAVLSMDDPRTPARDSVDVVVLEHAVHPSSLEEVRFSVAFVRPPPAAP